MPYQKSLELLKNELSNTENKLVLFLVTSNNMYSFSNELTGKQELEIIQPIKSFIDNKDYKKYDATEIKPDTVYYISSKMTEYKALDYILDLNNQILNDSVERATLKSIEVNTIKMIIFKKGTFIFLYRYTSSKLFKQRFIAIFGKEKSVIEKENNNILILSKMIPDIIIDTNKDIAFILNVTQAEYILEIHSLFVKTLNVVSENLKEFKLMKEESIKEFINEVSEKNSYMRKLHKIQTMQTYQYFINNIEKIPYILEEYDLNVNFDKDKGEIIFDEETDVGDVLHLFADDYIKRYISQRNDIIS